MIKSFWNKYRYPRMIIGIASIYGIPILPYIFFEFLKKENYKGNRIYFGNDE